METEILKQLTSINEHLANLELMIPIYVGLLIVIGIVDVINNRDK